MPLVTLAFENIGRSPAILVRVGAKVCLMERDGVPDPVPLSEIPSVERHDAIAAEGQGGARDWPFQRPVEASEVVELNNEVQERHFARLFVVGYVVYDDVFGSRTTNRFCVKVRHTGW